MRVYLVVACSGFWRVFNSFKPWIDIGERDKKKGENVMLTLPVSEPRDHIQGQATTSVTLVEYGDYECPYCAVFLFKHGQSLTDDNLRLSAAKLGHIVSKFDLEFHHRAHSRHIDEDIQSGKESGVTMTPTFINGDRYNDSWDLDSLLSALDEASVFSWNQASNSI